ncbi:2Fe-2S iron-sulfur cluster-binding protein [Curvibacter sp. PAE-UM]|uniref:2Fe-2S iron-sulfur cluster-binding protein n=1 Tax=Curvibacter sp. PAE-UM TaxID=1714344 RepID=UPI00070B04BC|nr:2Fe-2S iron-sulfur cluster-binding protein [Curvibacter sp. PAE-UM]KRH99148.1 ferredoxin-NAD reductase [Curvibacter sp. PAE-UM]
MIRLLQAALQWLFLRLEALFNAAFGVALNPLYHLGAISFFLFWVIAATGLYLYAFFETGVAGAYASVESITHGQWYLGGILRSTHRYASDAFVVTMLLHMVRYFAFNRYRSFRWFSWVTGVALIWLVYVSGINGYMLPWDKLAQFVIVATFEWLDWLPSFGGTLMRNFIYPSSVNDRFFSLLAFMHIGIPLLVLLLMWIHVQRVPKAATTPPRPMVIGILLTLLVMSLIVPVLSQGGATDLSVAVTTLKLDWFYLPLFPLLNEQNLGWIWGGVLGFTGLITVLPWLPPWRQRKAVGEFHLTIAGEPKVVNVRAGETLLDAGLRDGLSLPYECRNGGCGVCLCTVVHGSVDHGLYQRAALSDEMRDQGKTLMCCATPLSDLEIEVEQIAARSVSEAREYLGRVETIERLSPQVILLRLSLPAGESIAFTAGQYINFVLDDGQRRAFSFANPPQTQALIELHVRLIPGGRFTSHVFHALKVGDSLRFEGPHGHFVLQPGTAPIIFVAGATGFAPIKSIVEDAFLRGIERPMWLYWGVREPADLYMKELAEAWQRAHPDFHFVPVLSEASPGDAWSGRRGLVHEAILQDFPDLAGHEVYVCGSARMVESAIPAFLAQGLSDDACFSDAFLPAR